MGINLFYYRLLSSAQFISILFNNYCQRVFVINSYQKWMAENLPTDFPQNLLTNFLQTSLELKEKLLLACPEDLTNPKKFNLYYSLNLVFSCDSSSISRNVGLSVCRSVCRSASDEFYRSFMLLLVYDCCYCCCSLCHQSILMLYFAF